MAGMQGKLTVSLLQDKIIAAQAAVQSELDALKQGLQKRQQAAKVKALLELMQDTAHVMSKVCTLNILRIYSVPLLKMGPPSIDVPNMDLAGVS